ncbi:MAG: ABC transporter permease [Bacteroidetes bacterium]|nr:ABC transporter permease [Bacteroidota bacterium]MBS1633134.1 ABC transporter permease [Bacteroidota bacterium]
MKKITKYVLVDILRNKIVIGYTIFLFLISLSVFNLEDSSSKGLLSLLNIILIIVPLVSVIFSTIYIYNSAEFIELLVSQPLKRKQLWASLFTGLAGSLTFSFFIGIGIPVLLYAASATGYIMIIMGLLLTVIFVAIALLAAVIARDKAKGIGFAIFLWLYFSLLFDGLILFILFQFQEYPLEKFMVVAAALNPIDLSRIMVLLKMDTSALMGYTGAVFRDFFGSNTGFIIAVAILFSWVVTVFWLSLRRFQKKDL